jgi:hypothetical protein
MDSATDREDQETKPDGIAGDRRFDRRYQLQLDLKWKLIRRRRVLDTGSGRTIDLSSGGLLFEANRDMPEGLNVELSITWPVLLHNVAPLQLLVYGRIVRSEGKRIAVQKNQHEFRTMGITADQRKSLAASSRTPANLLGKTTNMPNFGKLQ